MGTGAGILALEAAKHAEEIVAVDINSEAVEQVKKTKNKKIKAIQSDLFDNIDGKFDLIIFNPPYLPDDPEVKDIALDGGPEGYEFIERFLKKTKPYLKEDGKILLLYLEEVLFCQHH